MKTTKNAYKRLKSAAFTAGFVFTLLLAVLAGSFLTGGGGTIGVFSQTDERTVYCIAYRGTDEKEGLELLRSDLAYFRSIGLKTVLPDALDRVTGSAAVVVIENCADTEDLCRCLEEFEAKAVLAPSPRLSDSAEKAFAAGVESGLLQPAACIAMPNSLRLVCEEISGARLEFFEEFGMSCSCFIETAEALPGSAENGADSPAPSFLTLFVYGNGQNTLEKTCGGRVLNRIVRLPDWTIEEYFSDIAVSGG